MGTSTDQLEKNYQVLYTAKRVIVDTLSKINVNGGGLSEKIKNDATIVCNLADLSIEKKIKGMKCQ